jgi:hypothetical protein
MAYIDPLFDQLSASTLAEMQRDIVQDNFFIDGAWQRIMRYYAIHDPFTGGLFMQEPFIFARINGGASTPGADRQVVQKQILGAMGFTPREYTHDIPWSEWDTEVLNAGPAAAVPILDMYYQNAVESASTDFNIDFYVHGQPAQATVAQNRPIFMNGADEACSNGIDPGYLGNVYPLYGGNLRNGVVTSTLNSGVTWAGDGAGNPGQINYGTLLGAYLNCVQPPDTGLGNKVIFQGIGQRTQPQQMFLEEGMSIKQENDARIGLTGFRILEGMIHVDKLAPSTRFGAMLPSGMSQTTSTILQPFTTPANVTAISGYPASKQCFPGEPFFWFRLQDWKLRPPTSPRYNHYFCRPIASQTNPDLKVVFYQNGINCYTVSPRDNWQVVGFGY